MREESTRQLNRAVVEDWNYQSEFKEKRNQEEKLAADAAAYHEKQVWPEVDFTPFLLFFLLMGHLMTSFLPSTADLLAACSLTRIDVSDDL